MGRRAKDLTGMKFGRLTVIEGRGKDKRRNALWLCKCDCGNERVVCTAELKRGHTTSCGCTRKNKFQAIGQKFGRLTVVKESGRDKHGNTLWLCKCECGNETIVIGRSLKTGHTLSCGCYQKDMLKEKSGENSCKWKGGITPISKYLRGLNEQWFNDCKQQANYTCELTGKVGGKLHTHHLKAFSIIVLEAHELNNIEIHETIGEYTEEELHRLEEYIMHWHKDTSNAVVLCEEVHTLFHNLYGYGDNTKEQYEEFKQRYLSGEFEKIIK